MQEMFQIFLNRTKPQHILRAYLCVGLIVLDFIAACTSPTFPLKISDVSVYLEPIVGEMVQFSVRVVSTVDEPDVVLSINLFEEEKFPVNLMGGKTDLNFGLKANEEKTIIVEICVSKAGTWPIEINVFSNLADGNRYGDFKRVYIQSTAEGGELIENREHDNIVSLTPRPTYDTVPNKSVCQ